VGYNLILQHQGIITRQAAQTAAEVLKRGTKEFPSNGQIWFDYGFIYYWDLFNVLTNKQEQMEARAYGIKILQKASMMDDAPAYAGNLASSGMQESGLADLAVEHIKNQLFKETKPELRHLWEIKLQQSLGEQAKVDIKLAKELFDTWTKEYQYIPFSLFTILNFPEISQQSSQNSENSLR
jgi:hypothetical protein